MGLLEKSTKNLYHFFANPLTKTQKWRIIIIPGKNLQKKTDMKAHIIVHNPLRSLFKYRGLFHSIFFLKNLI